MAKAIAVRFWRCIPRRAGIELDDLIGIANLALVECVDRYKPEVAKFSTFAYLSLRGRILDYLGALPALRPVSLEDFFQDFACPGPPRARSWRRQSAAT
jgi:RNA polymerase sigma factor for flagellar operon FliA